MALDLTQHPCFHADARKRTGRIHLPVAPRCNVQCNYCDRKFDCMNESRPGVTSKLLTPVQAVEYLARAVEKVSALKVAGIAGPGDPFACADETLETLRLARERFPEMLLCVASNGLEVAPHADALAELGVSHVTLTINAVNPAIGAKIYAWVRLGRTIYRGVEAAHLLLERQHEAVAALKARGIVVKVNSILIPGVNDEHLPRVAEAMAAEGADIMNCVPLYPVAGTVFGEYPEPASGRLHHVRAQLGQWLPQMAHCTRCRADAAGLLGEGPNAELVNLMASAAAGQFAPPERRYVAVASEEGLLVNQHLGEAAEFLIYEGTAAGPHLVEKRAAPEEGGGMERWQELGESLADCRAVFVSGVGNNPRKTLESSGLAVIEMYGLIADALDAYCLTGEIPRAMSRKFDGCGKACSGTGGGC
jgi:nitrogen fixation protein NifB